MSEQEGPPSPEATLAEHLTMAPVAAESISEWIDALAKARHLAKLAAEKEAEAKAAITSWLEDQGAETGTIGGVPRIRWRPTTSTRFAQAKFKAEHPDLYDNFSTTTTVMRLELH